MHKTSHSNSKKNLGTAGENFAARYLIAHGYKILYRNYHCKAGEVDIIGQDKECIVFIEVKTRRSTRYGEPLEAITIQKQQRICRIATNFLLQKKYNIYDIRFDIIAILLQPNRQPHIEHIRNAFECME